MSAGTIRLTRARLLDAFGRTLDLPAAATAAVPVRNEVPGRPGTLRLRPRLPRPARWLFRLVDAADVPEPAEALVDQVDPAQVVNPVAGFLLPDHLDESLEVFDAAGRPVGELFHEPIGGGVVWEIAPGRHGPAGRGPGCGLAGGQVPLGWLATGLLARRRARTAPPPSRRPSRRSAALLRAIDTMLWTVDTFGDLGSRARRRPGRAARSPWCGRGCGWTSSPRRARPVGSRPRRPSASRAEQRPRRPSRFEVRLGEITRTDDGLLGFFVGDDFAHLHLVDQVIAGLAKPAGPARPLGADEPVDADHPPVRHGRGHAPDPPRADPQLTLLMHPAGRVHLTSGILPRKSLALAT